jgi:hypothetical protein
MPQFHKLSKLAALSLLIFATHSYAGGMEGGGGNSVMCRDSQGKMVSAEVYDIFEGRALYGYFPKSDTADYKTQARAIAKKLADASADEFFVKETERILNEVRFLPPDAALVPVTDSGSIIKPANCDVFQTAVYLANQRVYFDSNIWNLLNESNRAALVSHEVIYAYLRNTDGAKTSTRARQYVAFMYSGQNLRPKWQPADGEHYEFCRTDYDNPLNVANAPMTAFYTRVNPDGTWKVSFNYFNGLKVLGATEINSQAPQKYSWPIALHKFGKGDPGGFGVGLDENLNFDVDEGWIVQNWFLDLDSSNNYVSVQSSGQWNQIYFSCQHYNF